MAIVLSARARVPFCPNPEAESPRTYLLAVPTRLTRLAFQQDYAAALQAAGEELGGRLDVRGRHGMLDLADEGIDAVVAEDQRAGLHAIVARLRAAEPDAEAEAEFRQIEAALAQAWPPYRQALQDRAISIELAAEAACRRFVLGLASTGSARGDELWPRTRAGLADAELARIPEADRVAIYLEVERLAAPTEEERKN